MSRRPTILPGHTAADLDGFALPPEPFAFAPGFRFSELPPSGLVTVTARLWQPGRSHHELHRRFSGERWISAFASGLGVWVALSVSAAGTMAMKGESR